MYASFFSLGYSPPWRGPGFQGGKQPRQSRNAALSTCPSLSVALVSTLQCPEKQAKGVSLGVRRSRTCLRSGGACSVRPRSAGTRSLSCTCSPCSAGPHCPRLSEVSARVCESPCTRAALRCRQTRTRISQSSCFSSFVFASPRCTSHQALHRGWHPHGDDCCARISCRRRRAFGHCHALHYQRRCF